VWVVSRPFRNLNRPFADPPYFTDFEPAKENMKIRRGSDESHASIARLDSPKPAKEKENVARADSLIPEMCLSLIRLSE
jgi:hypothetical protein